MMFCLGILSFIQIMGGAIEPAALRAVGRVGVQTKSAIRIYP